MGDIYVKADPILYKLRSRSLRFLSLRQQKTGERFNRVAVGGFSPSPMLAHVVSA